MVISSIQGALRWFPSAQLELQQCKSQKKGGVPGSSDLGQPEIGQVGLEKEEL